MAQLVLVNGEACRLCGDPVDQAAVVVLACGHYFHEVRVGTLRLCFRPSFYVGVSCV